MATLVCKVLGAALLIAGVWGFIDGERVLIFHVNTAHNVVHVLSGLAALACGFAGERPARVFSRVFGSVYLLVAALGFAGVAPAIDLLHLNGPDNWLHLAIGGAFLAGAAIPPSAVRRTLGGASTPRSGAHGAA